LTLYTDICKPICCDTCFETESVLTCYLITLTFDLSTSKWGNSSRFLLIFSLHIHGTGCQKRSGIFSRCNCLSLVSRLTWSAALPDTGNQDIDTAIVTADISRSCNGFAMLRRVINWRIYYYYYYYYCYALPFSI